jgi:AcrR family transcriptional regulator
MQDDDPADEPRGLRGHRTLDTEKMRSRREQIINAFADILAETDYDAASLDDVASKLSCSKAVIYYQFRSKEELFVEMSSTAMTIAYDNLCNIISTHFSVRDQLREAVSDLVRIGFEPIHAAALRCGAPSSLTRPSKRHLSDLSRQYRMKLAEVVARGIEEGCLESRDVRLVTNTLINASQSIFRWVKPDGPIPADVFIREVPAMVLGGVFVSPAGPSSHPSG